MAFATPVDGLTPLRTVTAEAIDHLAQVLRPRVVMGEDEDPQVLGMRHPTIEAPADIGGAALLAALEDKRPHLPRRGPLRLKLRVDVSLHSVEDEALDRPGFGPDPKALAGVPPAPSGSCKADDDM